MENGNKKNSGLMAVVVVVAVLIILGVVTFAIIPFLTVKKLADDSMDMMDGNYDTVVTAVITENTVHHDEDGTAYYTPVYEYEFNGKTYRVPAGVSSTDKKYVEGQKVEIRISSHFPGRMTDPNYNAKTAFKKASKTITGVFLVAAIVPVIMILAVVIIILAVIKSIRKKESNPAYTAPAQSDEYNDPNDDYRG